MVCINSDKKCQPNRHASMSMLFFSMITTIHYFFPLCGSRKEVVVDVHLEYLKSSDNKTMSGRIYTSYVNEKTETTKQIYARLFT